MGNGEAKELICATHGHELGGECWWEQGGGWRGIKGRKKTMFLVSSSMSVFFILHDCIPSGQPSYTFLKVENNVR